jgi:hypothetical protein
MGVGASSGVRFGLAELARIGPRSVVDGSRLGCRHGEEQVAVESELVMCSAGAMAISGESLTRDSLSDAVPGQGRPPAPFDRPGILHVRTRPRGVRCVVAQAADVRRTVGP